MERMALTGFNYGRLTSKGVLWYFPTPEAWRRRLHLTPS